MSNNEPKQYLLAIKRGNNDYLPLEWHLTSLYHNENLNTLEGIDSFTKRLTKEELLLEVIKLNMINLDERFVDFAIIYPTKDKFNELKEGCIFKSDNDILDENKNLNLFISANPEETIKALQRFKNVKYENRRSILIKLSKRVIIPELRKEYS